MPFIKPGDARIYYESFGEGFPVLAFAPGYLRAEIAFWGRLPSNPERKPPWINAPVDLVPPFRVIAMDQRYAGRSEAPLVDNVTWQTYADDHIAILDALEIERCHLIGVCIGTAFALELCARIPDRIASAVLQNPVGRTEAGRTRAMNEFARWAGEYRGTHPEAHPDALEAMGRNLFDRDFAFTVDREGARHVQTPVLVLPGVDPEDGPHPASVGMALAELLPHAELHSAWRDEADQASARDTVRTFLQRNTPY